MAGEVATQDVEIEVYEKPERDPPPGVQEGPDEELLAARAALAECTGKVPPAAQVRLGRACLFNDRLDEARAATKEALILCKEAEDHDSTVSAQALMCDVHLQALEVDDALSIATKALAICKEARDPRGRATFLSKQAVALNALGQGVDSLRTAEQAERAWREVGDASGEVEALIVIAEAKVAICEERGGSRQANGLNLTHLKAAQSAVRAAEAFRSDDYACLGNAHYICARVSKHLGSWKIVEGEAKAASKAFRKARQVAKRAQALVLWAEADLHRGYLQDARTRASRALDIFERFNDQEGLQAVSDVYDGVDRALGIPTRAQLEAHRQHAELMAQQQQQYFMWQQQQMQSGTPIPTQMMPPEMDSVDMPAAAQRGGGDVVVKAGVPLDLSAMVNEEAVQSKVLEVVKQLLGDDDEAFEMDVPLMEAGMTSNNAVLLRDILSKELPGVNLPPTLIFDYPSVGSITEYIIEKAMALKN